MAKLELLTVSPLEKILPSVVCEAEAYSRASALVGEELSYQLAIRSDAGIQRISARVSGLPSECVKLYTVSPVSVVTPHFPGIFDDLYITHTPALIPDVLTPLDSEFYVGENFSALWVSVTVNDMALAGSHTLCVSLFAGDTELGKSELQIKIIPARLPELDMPLTQWFHCDCIANYHGCEVFSDEFFRLAGEYMKVAASHGQNMILTPIFTPPLDTDVGNERRTVQLVDVEYTGTEWRFGFDRLYRWLELAADCGMKYIEISHLFTQWGALHAPKIEVIEDGVRVKKFGWHTDSLGDEYLGFLDSLLPKLKSALLSRWDRDRIYFHISDEPGSAHLERYGKIYEFMAPRLEGFRTFDALSSYEFYKRGFVRTPVVSTHRISDFLDKDIPELWCYYCCTQGNNMLANRFIAMPSVRNRIIGFEMYNFGIRGFLQWGYNFYNSRLSLTPIDPYVTNDAGGGFPAGDAFVVYPTRGGCSPSLRLKVFGAAIADLCAARLHEKLTSRQRTQSIVNSFGDITFTSYPTSPNELLAIRERINEDIEKAINGDI